MRLFVSVAAFCEPFLVFTLSDAIKKATDPQSIIFGLVDQHPFNRREALIAAMLEAGKNAGLTQANLRYIHINPHETRGVCWARSLVFSLFQQEDFVLQIDSHTLFEENWDTVLYQQYADLLEKSPKHIISTYPYGFEFENGEPVIKVTPGEKSVLVLRPHPDTSLSEKNATLRFRAEHFFTLEPVLGCHLAGGFLFTAGHFVQEVPYDPYLYFHGEEQSLAVRAWTRGWDIYHLLKIPLYHLYKIPNMAYSNHHWHPDWDKKRDFKAVDLKQAGVERLADLLYQRKDLGVYGLGSQRNLEEYAVLSGINYLNKTLVQPYQQKYA